MPEPTEKYSRKRMLKALPDALEVALGLLLEEVDMDRPSSSAIACRIIAAAITRLKD